MTAASGVRRHRWARALAARFCATQISQFGRCNDGRSGGQLAAHSGGHRVTYRDRRLSRRVTACPVRERPDRRLCAWLWRNSPHGDSGADGLVLYAAESDVRRYGPKGAPHRAARDSPSGRSLDAFTGNPEPLRVGPAAQVFRPFPSGLGPLDVEARRLLLGSALWVLCDQPWGGSAEWRLEHDNCYKG